MQIDYTKTKSQIIKELGIISLVENIGIEGALKFTYMNSRDYRLRMEIIDIVTEHMPEKWEEYLENKKEERKKRVREVGNRYGRNNMVYLFGTAMTKNKLPKDIGDALIANKKCRQLLRKINKES